MPQWWRDENELTERIIGCAIEVHKHLGPGLLESAYEECLCYELDIQGISYRRQVMMAIEFKGKVIDKGYRMDVLVEETVIVEIKAIEALTSTDTAQILTQMKFARKRLGLLINFNVTRLVDGLRRFVR
jgi:GxxExxY protein